VFIPHLIKASRDPNTYVRNTFKPAAHHALTRVCDVTAGAGDVMTRAGDVTLTERRSVTRSYGGGAAVVDGSVYLVGGRSDQGICDRVSVFSDTITGRGSDFVAGYSFLV
jgi:hypothetical protein